MRTIQWILIGVFLGVSCLLFYDRVSIKKSSEKLLKELNECRNRPIKIVYSTKYDTIYIDKIVYPKPKPHDNGGLQKPSDTTADTICAEAVPCFYSDVYETEGNKIYWEAETAVENDSAKLTCISFTKVILKRNVETITEKSPPDTVYVDKKLSGKFGIYGGLFGNNFNEFPGVEAGVGYLHKQSWSISAGPMYKDNKVYGNLRIFIAF